VAIGLLWVGVCQPYFNHPSASLEVDNRTGHQLSVVFHTETNDCGGSGSVGPHRQEKVESDLTGILCWGAEVSEVNFGWPGGSWVCDWKEASRKPPLVFTEEGPACTKLSGYTFPTPPSPPYAARGSPISPPASHTPVP
jgi:hypothetical protein